MEAAVEKESPRRLGGLKKYRPLFSLSTVTCAIHNIKPRTCLAYGREDCLANHPGMAR
jgi:hypothetical protein